MELTRIETENLEGFLSFLPAGLLTEEDQAVGVLSGEGEPMGAAVFSPTEEGVALKWIFVDPEERRKGVATLLLHDAMTLLHGNVPVLTVSYRDEAEGVEALLLHLGFAITEGDPFYVIPIERIYQNPIVKKLRGKSSPEGLLSLAEAGPENNRALQAFLNEETGGTAFLEGIDREYSFMTCTKDYKAAGCLLAVRDGHTLEVKLLLNRAPGNADQMISALIRKCMDDAEVQELCFVAAAPKLEQTVDHMLDKALACKKHLRYALAAL